MINILYPYLQQNKKQIFKKNQKKITITYCIYKKYFVTLRA